MTVICSTKSCLQRLSSLHPFAPGCSFISVAIVAAALVMLYPGPCVSAAYSAPVATDIEKALIFRTGAVKSRVLSPVRKVLLIGDSFMQGYGPQLKSLLARRGISVVDASRPATGLVICNVPTWYERFPRLMDRHQPQLVICSLGANDTQNIRTGNKILVFGKNEWISEYERRIMMLLTTAEQSDARFVWLGLPRMRSSAYDLKVKLVNSVCSRMMAVNGGRYIGISAAAGFNAAERADDGIHFVMKGYRCIAGVVVNRLDDDNIL